MTHELFRKEVLLARRAGWLGGISLSQPAPLRVLALAFSTTALAVALFLLLGSYTRRSTVTGQLVPSLGLATVPAPATGIVTRLEASEGDRIEAGQALAVVTVPRATLASGNTNSALAQRLRRRRDGLESFNDAQRQLHATQADGIAAQLATARRELAQLESEIATRRKQARIIHETLDRLRQLQQDRYVSILQIKQQEVSALEQVAAVQALQRQATAVQRNVIQLQQALREIPGQRQATEAGFQRDLAQLEQERVETEARGELLVQAPLGGVIATQLIKPGQAVQAGQPLLSVLPGDGRLEAELRVPSHAIGFIEPGDRVLLRYRAYPYQKFGHHAGIVARISRSAMESGEAAAPSGNAPPDEATYRVTVTLARQDVTAYGRAEPLKPGMSLDADILGEKRRLIEWVLEPLHSLESKVGDG